MNTISPYTIRCFDPLMKGKKAVNSYSPLGTIGQFDMYEVFKSYITSKGAGYHVLQATEQIYAMARFKFDDAKREIRGIIRAGSYGSRTDIVNIKTGNIDFRRMEENAEVLNHYVRFFVPAELNEGVVLLHNQKNIGIKTLVYELLREEFARVTGRVLQMNPLSY